MEFSRRPETSNSAIHAFCKAVWIVFLFLGFTTLSWQAAEAGTSPVPTRPAAPLTVQLPGSTSGVRPVGIELKAPDGTHGNVVNEMMLERSEAILAAWSKEAPLSFLAVIPGDGAAGECGILRNHRGEDFGRMLMAEGIAKVSWDVAPKEWQAYYQDLLGWERTARMQGRGRWVRGDAKAALLSRSGSPEVAGDFGTIPATESAGILERLGKVTSVTGKISRVGSTPSGHIQFVNFEGVDRGGFVVIVRSESLPGLQQVAPEFPGNLVGKYVRISGRITQYESVPQIELQTPGQVVILD